MKRSTSVLFSLLMLGLFILSAKAQPPSLEGQITLPAVVNGSVSVVSDGYGQHFIKIDPNTGYILHYLAGNDGVELTDYRGTVSTVGTFPVITSYAGKLRTTFNVGTNIYVYQSTNGGVNWAQVGTPYPFTAGSVYNIDAHTDGYGTHIVWQDRSDFASEPEVYYVRWDDRIPNWADYKNVSDLSGIPGQWGRRPKVVASASKAHVAYPHLGMSFIVSRDLDLTNSQWDNFYSTPSSQYLVGESISTAVIGTTVYAVVNGPYVLPQSPAVPTREIRFASMVIGSSTWNDHGLLAGSHLGIDYNGRNLVAGPDGKLYFLNTCYADDVYDCYAGEYDVQLRTYTPGSGWGSTEWLGSTDYNGLPAISTSRFGVYSVWGDNLDDVSCQYMRGKHEDRSVRAIECTRNRLSTSGFRCRKPCAEMGPAHSLYRVDRFNDQLLRDCEC